MNQSILKIVFLSIFVLTGLHHGESVAGAKNATSGEIRLQQAYVWYDGEQERQIWFDPALVAEFNAGSGNTAQSAVKSVYADAVPVPMRHGAVRVWYLGSGVEASAAVSALNSIKPAGNYSPVLRDGPTTTGRMRALPGNIIVYLNPAWDSAAVNTWISQRKLEIVKKLEIGPNIYIIKTGPGLEALNTANALYKSGEVVAAFPDWWEEVTTR